ncbi:IgGFc-binding protein [Polyangium aurulentum]|uniref:IgGFc-binding protein n=1 Tax=Polyangium aurulentum TaxID=2567896 RepID=UPI00113A4D66|nr:IgGFc-binding protein [Polyangium aurulentum]UQA61824.1 IgGFc-binding protein [Polyangium aurulentum]
MAVCSLAAAAAWGAGCNPLPGLEPDKPLPDAGGGGGAGGGIDIPDGGVGCCDIMCSSDMTAVIDCDGNVLEQCTPDQGCANAKCIDDPCEAARATQSSYGCDYWAIKTALRPQADFACFAAFVANIWTKPVKLNVSYDGQALQPDTFAYIPKIGANGAIDYTPYDNAKGIGVGEAAILFLSVLPGGNVPSCPRPTALALETGVPGTGKGKGFHIQSDFPIAAYQTVPYGGGMAAVPSATLLLPTSAWHTNYLAVNAYQAAPDGDPNNPFGGYPALEIVAREDATKVTILPKMPIVGGAGVMPAVANTPVTYELDAGEFLQITQPNELTGSIIDSDKAIAVFGASTCMKVPTNLNDCDSGQQQITPVRALGSEYVAVRYKSRSAAMEESTKWRIVGAVDGTELTWEGTKPAGAPATIDQGQIVELDGPGPFVVRSQAADHPFYLGSYMTGGAPFANDGDPDWVNVVPPQQYLKRYVFFTDPTYPETSLVVVRAPNLDGTFDDVQLKCRGVLDGWQKIGGYEYTRVNLVTGNFSSVNGCTNGRHEMSSDSPFAVTVWGWGTTPPSKLVSYAYPAGAGVFPINEVKIPTTPQ